MASGWHKLKGLIMSKHKPHYKHKAKQFYDSKAWQSCREYYIQTRVMIDGGLCEACGERLGHIVDHIEELDDSKIQDPMIALNHDNLQYLCLDCHNAKTFNRHSRAVRFDEEGNPIFIEIKR